MRSSECLHCIHIHYILRNIVWLLANSIRFVTNVGICWKMFCY